jgi:hypothetical protein
LIGVPLTFLALPRTGDDQTEAGCQQKNQSPHQSIVTLKGGVGRLTSDVG